VLDSDKANKLINITLFGNVEELVPNEKYKVEWYTLQTVSDKSQAEIMALVEADFDGYLALAKKQMQGDVEALKTSDLDNKIALAQIYELVLS